MSAKLPKNLKTRVAGFTLIELLVAIAIFAVILAGLLLMLSSFLKVRNNDNTEQALKTEGNYILDRLEFLVRNGVTMPDICCSSGSPVTCNGGGGTTLAVNLENLAESSGRLAKNEVSFDGESKILLNGEALNSDQMVVTGVNFRCAVTNSGAPNQRASVTIDFELMTAEEAEKDLLGETIAVSQHFTRTVAVANNYPYIFDAAITP